MSEPIDQDFGNAEIVQEKSDHSNDYTSSESAATKDKALAAAVLSATELQERLQWTAKLFS